MSELHPLWPMILCLLLFLIVDSSASWNEALIEVGAPPWWLLLQPEAVKMADIGNIQLAVSCGSIKNVLAIWDCKTRQSFWAGLSYPLNNLIHSLPSSSFGIGHS